MPIIESAYRPGRLYHRHISTILMGRLRRLPDFFYTRQRIGFDDSDFLDLDWIHRGSQKLMIVCHGLEGSSASHGVRAIAAYFSKQGNDILAINLRGCSGEPNTKIASYNSGSSDQLQFIIDYVVRSQNYDSIFLIGISVGGNIVLKYLGEQSANLDSRLKAAVAISVPCDLAGSSAALERFENRIYLIDFLRSLKRKVRSKLKLIPVSLNLERIMAAATFEEFDSSFTAPINGYSSAGEYYKLASCLPMLPYIRIPTLLLSALDDPFLSPGCFPYRIAKNSAQLFLETPDHGGHVAFPVKGIRAWLEPRIDSFFSQY